MSELHADIPSPEKRLSLSLTQERDRLNVLKIAFYVLFIICLALSLFSWHTWKHTDSKTLLAIVCICLLTKIGSLLGILGSFKSIQDLRYKNLDSNNIRIAAGHQILIFAFYFLILVLLAFIIFGTRALFYSDRSIAYLDAKFHSAYPDWLATYGDISLDQMEKWALMMTNVVGYTCYIIVFLILLITYLLLAITMTYGIINSITSLISLGILLLTWSILYILLYAVRFRSKMDFYIPINLIIVVIALALLLTTIAVVSYIISITDKVTYIKFYIGLCFIGSVLAVFSTLESIQVSRSLVSQMHNECFDFIAMVDEKYIKTLGCGEKYLNVTDTEDLLCDKGQQRYIWEQHGDYGCLNPLCCEILVTDSKAKFDYLGICSASSIAIIIVSLWSCYYLYCKSELEDFYIKPINDKKILVAVIFLSMIWVYLISFHLPPVPETVPYKTAGVVVSEASTVDSRLLSAGYCILLQNLEISCEKCEECEKSEFSLSVDGKGIVRGDNFEIKSVHESENIDIQDFDCEKIKEVINKMKLCPQCTNDFWNIQVFRKDFFKNNTSEEKTL